MKITTTKEEQPFTPATINLTFETAIEVKAVYNFIAKYFKISTCSSFETLAREDILPRFQAELKKILDRQKISLF